MVELPDAQGIERKKERLAVQRSDARDTVIGSTRRRNQEFMNPISLLKDAQLNCAGNHSILGQSRGSVQVADRCESTTGDRGPRIKRYTCTRARAATTEEGQLYCKGDGNAVLVQTQVDSHQSFIHVSITDRTSCLPRSLLNTVETLLAPRLMAPFTYNRRRLR